MEGFGLLIGHLIGDYIFQEDWLSGNKTNPLPGPEPTVFPTETVETLNTLTLEDSEEIFTKAQKQRAKEVNQIINNWRETKRKANLGHITCTIHCFLYTLAIFITSPWMPWWAYLATGLVHWPIDRFRLARKWMSLINQENFATGDYAPWSIILVDNTFHLITLYIIALLSKSAMGLP